MNSENNIFKKPKEEKDKVEIDISPRISFVRLMMLDVKDPNIEKYYSYLVYTFKEILKIIDKDYPHYHQKNIIFLVNDNHFFDIKKVFNDKEIIITMKVLKFENIQIKKKKT